MATDFDRKKFINDLQQALEVKEKTALLGAKLVQEGIERVYFVGCGAPNRAMSIVQYELERLARTLDIRRYYPAELVTQTPPTIDNKTLVVLGSHSGTTRETVEAAEFLRELPCTTIGISQTDNSPLARMVDHPLLYGESDQGYFAMYMLLQALAAAILNKREGWVLYEKVIASLDALPSALADAAEANEVRATEEARIYKDDRILYLVGSGPSFATAYVFGVCVLMEMQWMHTYPVEAAEFFHGPFEVVDHTTPLILLVAEDPSRPLAERVVRFCKRYTERLMIYDSRDFAMEGIAPEVRPLVAPLILQAALRRIAEHLAVWHNQPLSTRRYMWQTEY